MELFLHHGYVCLAQLRVMLLHLTARTALGIPYEIVALNVLLTYWTDRVPVAAVVVIVMVLYA